MNIRIFLLKNEQNSYAARFAEELRCVFGENIPENGITEAASMRDIADVTAQAFADSHVIMFFAEPAKFAETKSVLSKALGLPLHCEKKLFEKAAETARSLADEKSTFAAAHAYIPDNALLFPCGDGLFTGFSVSAGNQTIYFLPLERGRSDVLLAGRVIAAINSAYGTKADINALRAFNAGKLSALCAENDIRIAVAGTNTAAFFRDYLSSSPALIERMSFAGTAEKRGTMSPADYVVNLSITAAEFFGTPYGVAISNAFYSGDTPDSQKIIYLAITNEHETALREIRSVQGEDIPALLARCCGDLCAFIGDIAQTDAGKKEVNEVNEKSLIKQYKKAICIVAALAVLIGGFGAYYFIRNDYSLKMWFSNAWSVVFPGSDPIFVTEPLTVSGSETESTTEESSAETTGKAAANTTKKPAAEKAKTTKASSSSSGSSRSSSSSGSSSRSSGSSSSGSSSSSSSEERSSSDESSAPAGETTTAAPETSPQQTEPSEPASSDTPSVSEEPHSAEEPSSADEPASAEEPASADEPASAPAEPSGDVQEVE